MTVKDILFSLVRLDPGVLLDLPPTEFVAFFLILIGLVVLFRRLRRLLD